MQSNRFMMLSLAALLCLAAAGCRSTKTSGKDAAEAKQPAATPGHFTAETDAPAREAAERFVAEFAAALKAGDREKLPEMMHAKVTESMFKRMCDSFSRRRGVLCETAFVTELDQTIVRDYLWKFTFEKSLAAAPAAQGESAVPAVQKNEVIYLVRVGILDGKPVIVGCGFQE